MKRILAAVVLIVLVIGFYITGYLFVDSTCETAKELLSDCVMAYENEDDVNNRISKLENFWNKKESVLSIFINHGSIDEIELAIESLSVQSKYPKNQMFFEHSGNIKILLHQIMEDTKIGMHSIL